MLLLNKYLFTSLTNIFKYMINKFSHLFQNKYINLIYNFFKKLILRKVDYFGNLLPCFL